MKCFLKNDLFLTIDAKLGIFVLNSKEKDGNIVAFDRKMDYCVQFLYCKGRFLYQIN